MFAILSSLWRQRRLVKDFVVRDLKARYVGSSMGFFWSVVFPIINLFVYMFVFRLVLNARWGDKQSAIEVAIVMLAGIVIWTAFAETISRATNTLVDNSNLIQKVVFPAEVLPIYLTISSLINMCIGLPVVLLATFWIGHVSEPGASIYSHHDWENAAEEPRGVPALDANGEEILEKTEDGETTLRRMRYPLFLHEGMEHLPAGAWKAREHGVSININRGWHDTVTVPFTLSGTAVEGEDYKTLGAHQVQFEPGTTKVWLNIIPLTDGVEEGDETVIITLGEPTGADLIQTIDTHALEYTVTIKDSAENPETDEGAVGSLIPWLTVPPEDKAYYPLKVGIALVSLPVLFLIQVLFTSGLGFFLSAFNLFLRDTYHLVGVGVTVWMFATPIFYPGWMVEQKGFGWMLQINPMHWLIDMYRGVILHGLWPPVLLLVKTGAVSLVTLFIGAKFFRAHAGKFPDLL